MNYLSMNTETREVPQTNLLYLAKRKEQSSNTWSVDSILKRFLSYICTDRRTEQTTTRTRTHKLAPSNWRHWNGLVEPCKMSACNRALCRTDSEYRMFWRADWWPAAERWLWNGTRTPDLWYCWTPDEVWVLYITIPPTLHSEHRSPSSESTWQIMWFRIQLQAYCCAARNDSFVRGEF